jgi:thiol-disulfide isomerase/thioredoxin
VLYFFANWCPICRAEFPLMEQAFNDITHDQVVGFRVNFNDSDTDGDEVSLARQYGVAYQHTKVFVKNGQRILKSPESWPKDRYLSEIKKALAK